MSKRKARDLGPCFKHPTCQNNGNRTYHCMTCEAVAKEKCADPDMSKVFKVQTCDEHDALAQKTIKRHAIVKHPSNLLKLTLAALRGEEI